MQVSPLVLQCGHRIDDLEPTPQKHTLGSNSLSPSSLATPLPSEEVKFLKALSQPLRNCRAGQRKQGSEQLLSLKKMLPHLTSRFRSTLPGVCILTDRGLTGILL
jgi:hypothetical protein